MRSMAFGTFDNLHPGHLSYLFQAGVFGDELIVVVARDENVLRGKGRLPQENEEVRRQKVETAVKGLKLKAKVILGNKIDRWQLLRELRPAFICLGYDQQVDLKALEELIAQERFFCEVKRMAAHYPEKYKSSLFRKD
ncbi:MAG TPA: adenylyltransferase/cytidyltransferase family protein [Candidatus Saccharimonadales bacterium]|nr:adenylyltransferase/cytidyltransferase family protein [Candidatus Saccharimonadales bacterium]